MAHPPVSIVIPTWNGSELLGRFLPSVLDALDTWPGGGEIVVYDDGGTDDTLRMLAEKFPSVRAGRGETNRGFASAANAGMASAAHRIAVLLNNDVEVERRFLAPLARWFDDPDVFAVAALSLDWDHETFRDGGKAGYWRRGFWRVWRNYRVEREGGDRVEWPSIYGPGGFTAFDRDKWLALGGLDEMFSPFNWEDTDICYRGLKRGWKVLYEPDSVVYHSPNTTIGGTSRRFRVRRISRRNQLLFHWKNLTDGRMLAANVLRTLLSLPVSLVTMDIAGLAGFCAAAGRLGQVAERRRVELREAVATDRELIDRFRALEHRLRETRSARLE